MFNRDEDIKALCPTLGLEVDSISFQFLWLVPIVELMWADGRCQREEVHLLLRYADRFVEAMRADVPGITRERVRLFLRPLLDPTVGRSPRKRAELTRLAAYILRERLASAHRDRRSRLFDICVDVAAAAHGDEAGESGRRFSLREEWLLARLLRDLGLDRNV